MGRGGVCVLGETTVGTKVTGSGWIWKAKTVPGFPHRVSGRGWCHVEIWGKYEFKGGDTLSLRCQWGMQAESRKLEVCGGHSEAYAIS